MSSPPVHRARHRAERRAGSLGACPLVPTTCYIAITNGALAAVHSHLSAAFVVGPHRIACRRCSPIRDIPMARTKDTSRPQSIVKTRATGLLRFKQLRSLSISLRPFFCPNFPTHVPASGKWVVPWRIETDRQQHRTSAQSIHSPPFRAPTTPAGSGRPFDFVLRLSLRCTCVCFLVENTGHFITVPQLRSTRSRIGDQFIAVTPGPHASEPIREYENYISSQFPSPASTASDGPWSSFQQVTSPSGPVQRAASPTSSTSNVSVMDNTPPIVGRGKKRRVSNNDKRAICVLHHNQPDLRQQDIADRWLIERSTVSKILRNKDRWLSIDPTEKRTVYRLRSVHSCIHPLFTTLM